MCFMFNIAYDFRKNDSSCYNVCFYSNVTELLIVNRMFRLIYNNVATVSLGTFFF